MKKCFNPNGSYLPSAVIKPVPEIIYPILCQILKPTVMSVNLCEFLTTLTSTR